MDTALGTAPENAPLLKWKAFEVSHVPKITANIKETVNGNYRWHTVRRPGEGLVQRLNYNIRVKIVEDELYKADVRYDLLRSMLGHFVYFVPNEHPDDGADHTAFVRVYALAEIADVSFISPKRQYYDVPIQLIDITGKTVALPGVYSPIDNTTYAALGSTARLT